MTYYTPERLEEVQSVKACALNAIDEKLAGKPQLDKSAIGGAAVALIAYAAVRAAMDIEPIFARKVAQAIKDQVKEDHEDFEPPTVDNRVI